MAAEEYLSNVKPAEEDAASYIDQSPEMCVDLVRCEPVIFISTHKVVANLIQNGPQYISALKHWQSTVLMFYQPVFFWLHKSFNTYYGMSQGIISWVKMLLVLFEGKPPFHWVWLNESVLRRWNDAKQHTVLLFNVARGCQPWNSKLPATNIRETPLQGGFNLETAWCINLHLPWREGGE